MSGKILANRGGDHEAGEIPVDRRSVHDDRHRGTGKEVERIGHVRPIRGKLVD
jgi:hypothetical protein